MSASVTTYIQIPLSRSMEIQEKSIGIFNSPHTMFMIGMQSKYLFWLISILRAKIEG